MPINSAHDEYVVHAPDWSIVRDAISGHTAVKAKGQEYLPIPPGMSSASPSVLDGGKRASAGPYYFYASFAEFPEIVQPTIDGFQGIIQGKPPTVKLPPEIEYLREQATPDGMSLEELWALLTKEVLSISRLSLLEDVGEDHEIRLVPYSIENLINWKVRSAQVGGGADFIVLREVISQQKPDDEFVTEEVIVFRELRMVSGVYKARLWVERGEGQDRKYVHSGFNELDLGADAAGWIIVNVSGEDFDHIPFHPLNAMSVGFNYEPVPIMPLVRRAYSIYRKSADYNRALYIKGDPQIFISGITDSDAPAEIGAGKIWTFIDAQAKAQYLDIDGQGIPLMRQAIQDEYQRFDIEGGKLLSTQGLLLPESGEALRRRQQMHQVTLQNVVMNLGVAFEKILKGIAERKGANPDDVLFSPSTDFTEPTMSAQDLLGYTAAKNNGAPWCFEQLHERMRRGGLTDLTYAEEKEKIADDHETLASIPFVVDTTGKGVQAGATDGAGAGAPSTVAGAVGGKKP